MSVSRDKNNWRKFWSNKIVNVNDYDTLNKISWAGFLKYLKEHSGLKVIKIKLKNELFIHEIDKREFEIYNQRYNNLKGINWEKRLKRYFEYEGTIFEAFELKTQIFTFIKEKIKFLRGDYEGKIILYRNYITQTNKTETLEELIEKVVIILKFGFGIKTSTDLKDFQIDGSMNKVNGLINLFDKKAKKFDEKIIDLLNFIEKKNNLKRHFYEIHFHICFLLLLNKVLGSSYWEAERECTRLHSLIENKNTTSTGRIDVFFEDEYGINIVELKCMPPFYRLTDIKKVEIEGIDQVCSYKLDGDVQPNLFLIIFLLNEEGNKFERILKERLKSYIGNNKFHCNNLYGDLNDDVEILNKTEINKKINRNSSVLKQVPSNLKLDKSIDESKKTISRMSNYKKYKFPRHNTRPARKNRNRLPQHFNKYVLT